MIKVNNKDTRITSLASLLTHFTPCSSVSIVKFEHAVAGWRSCLAWSGDRVHGLFILDKIYSNARSCTEAGFQFSYIETEEERLVKQNGENQEKIMRNKLQRNQQCNFSGSFKRLVEISKVSANLCNTWAILSVLTF